MILVLYAKDLLDVRAYMLGPCDMARAVEILQKLLFLGRQTEKKGQTPNTVEVYVVPEELIGRLRDGDARVLASDSSTLIGKAPLWLTPQELMWALDLARVQAEKMWDEAQEGQRE